MNQYCILQPKKKRTMPNKFKFIFFLFLASLPFVSCRKDDENTVPLRDYTEQYESDNDSIEGYLKSHYLNVIESDGLIDVEIKAIDNNQISIWNNEQYPLQSRTLLNPARESNYVDGRITDTVEYKLYYLVLNEGGGEKPTATDSVFCTYRGWTLDNEEFDKTITPFWSTYPAVSTSEITLISGFREFVPELRAAETVSNNPDGTISFNNYGAGVVFIPSALAYYDRATSGISAYSPISFLIRLNDVRYRDHDRDGVMSSDEDLNANGDLYDDDTDADNIPDFLDVDDDNDSYMTKYEILGPDGLKLPFADIPTCSGSTTGNKKHRDAACH